MQKKSGRFAKAIRWLERRVPMPSRGAAVWEARYHAAHAAANLARIDCERTTAATLARLSHEIRSPLMSISGFTDLLMRRGHLTREQRRYVSQISAASDTLVKIVSEFPATSAAVQQNEPPPASLAFEPDGLCRGKILLVEDLASNREIIMAYLEDGGCDVVAASSGAEAIALLGKDSFDLILMDIQMPGMDGVTATRFIRTMDPPLCTIPIIAMTGNVLPQQIHSFINAGMNDHLGKPIERKKLYGKLWSWLPRKAATEPVMLASSALFNRTRLDELIVSIGHHKVERTLREFAGQLSGCFHADIGAARREAHDLINAAGLLGFEQLLSQAASLKDTRGEGPGTLGLLDECRLTRDAVLEVIAGTVLPHIAEPETRRAG